MRSHWCCYNTHNPTSEQIHFPPCSLDVWVKAAHARVGCPWIIRALTCSLRVSRPFPSSSPTPQVSLGRSPFRQPPLGCVCPLLRVAVDWATECGNAGVGTWSSAPEHCRATTATTSTMFLFLTPSCLLHKHIDKEQVQVRRGSLRSWHRGLLGCRHSSLACSKNVAQQERQKDHGDVVDVACPKSSWLGLHACCITHCRDRI